MNCLKPVRWVHFQVFLRWHLKLYYCRSQKTVTNSKITQVAKTLIWHSHSSHTIGFWAEYQPYYLHLLKKTRLLARLMPEALFKMAHMSNLWPTIQVITHNKIKGRCVNAISLPIRVRCKCQTSGGFLTQTWTIILSLIKKSHKHE